MKERVGPSLWHGREINSCVRCKFLRCKLVKSGRHPDYEHFCMHPDSLSGEVSAEHFNSLLAKVGELLPDKLEQWKQKVDKEKAEVAVNGEFISNDSYTPETPEWCPVVRSLKATA